MHGILCKNYHIRLPSQLTHKNKMSNYLAQTVRSRKVKSRFDDLKLENAIIYTVAAEPWVLFVGAMTPTDVEGKPLKKSLY